MIWVMLSASFVHPQVAKKLCHYRFDTQLFCTIGVFTHTHNKPTAIWAKCAERGSKVQSEFMYIMNISKQNIGMLRPRTHREKPPQKRGTCSAGPSEGGSSEGKRCFSLTASGIKKRDTDRTERTACSSQAGCPSSPRELLLCTSR